MEPKKVSNGLALRKVAALTKGDLKEEDCVMISFLVGTEDASAEEIRAFKFDLLVASEYFQGLLRSPAFTPDGPVRIEHVDPEIFRLVVEFTHLSGHLVSEVNFEQCLKLTAAADEFMLDELGQLCTEKLEELINVDNVWTVFSKNHLIKYTSAVCEELLSLKTEECLKKPAFLEIDENALVKFLNLKEMSIKSEMQLVSACLEFVSRKEDGRAVFRQCALPHLRLLTLSADDDLAELAPFLEKDEKLFLILNNLEKDSLQIKNDFLVNTTLCKITKPRNPFEEKAPEEKDFVPAELLGYRSKICQSDHRRFQYTCSSGGVVLTWNKGIKSKELNNIIRKMDCCLDAKILCSSCRDDGWIFNTTANVTVTSKGGFGNCSVNLHLSQLQLSDVWDQMKSFISIMPKRKVQIEVTITKTFNFTHPVYPNGREESLEDILQQLRADGKKFSLVVPTCKCPHLNLVKPPPEEGIVLTMSESHEDFSEGNPICLTCYAEVHDNFRHSKTFSHSKQHSHPLFLTISSVARLIEVWCCQCKQKVDAPALYDAKNAAHLAKFGTEMPWTCRGEIKIEVDKPWNDLLPATLEDCPLDEFPRFLDFDYCDY